MFRRIVTSNALLPAGVFAIARDKRFFLTAPTPLRLDTNKVEETDDDVYDVFEDDDLWFMEELLGEGGEMDFVIPSEEARMLQGEKQ